MVKARKITVTRRRPLIEAPIIWRRVACRDDDGNSVTILVWQVYPGLPLTRYTLMDRTPVEIVSDCEFLLPSGRSMFRC